MTIACLIGVATVGCVSSSAQERVAGSGDPVAGVAQPADGAIEDLIDGWFEALSSLEPSTTELERSLPEGSFELVLFDERITSRGELRNWVASMGESYSSVAYAVGSIRVERESEGVYRAEFEVTRQASDRNELVHIARRAQIWRLRREVGRRPVVFEATETMLLPYPGTGSQVICL